jgi:tetratricopeptide (TPR) repeat protein
VNSPIVNAVIGRRLLLDRSPAGGRLRRRAVAGGGLSLLVLGFLLAVGLRTVVLLILGVFLLVAVAPLAIALAQTARPHLRTPRLPQVRVRIPRPPQRRHGRQRAVRLNVRGVNYRRRGEHRRAVEAHGEALVLMRIAGDRPGEALTLNNLALALAKVGQDEAALDRFEEALAILRELDDEQREGQVFANLGLMHGRRGRREQAVGCLQVALQKLDPGSPAYRRVEEQLRRAS